MRQASELKLHVYQSGKGGEGHSGTCACMRSLGRGMMWKSWSCPTGGSRGGRSLRLRVGFEEGHPGAPGGRRRCGPHGPESRRQGPGPGARPRVPRRATWPSRLSARRFRRPATASSQRPVTRGAPRSRPAALGRPASPAADEKSRSASRPVPGPSAAGGAAPRSLPPSPRPQCAGAKPPARSHSSRSAHCACAASAARPRREGPKRGGGARWLAAARCGALRFSSPGRRGGGAGAMRRYLRLAMLCLACGFCSLLYAFSQLAVSPEGGAGGGGGKPQAAAASWLAAGGRGAARGAGSAGPAAHPGRSDRYGPFPVSGPGQGRGGGRGAWGSAWGRRQVGPAPQDSLPPLRPPSRIPLLPGTATPFLHPLPLHPGARPPFRIPLLLHPSAAPA